MGHYYSEMMCEKCGKLLCICKPTINKKLKTMTKTPEELRKKYIKSNKEARIRLLRKYGVNSLERLLALETTTKPIVKLTLAELSQKLLNTPNKEITISFQKKLNAKEISSALYDSIWTHKLTYDGIGNVISKGKERIVKGFHKNSTDYFGRLWFTDFEQEKNPKHKSDSRMILVTLFNLNYVIIDGVKYVKK
jgi:hypothetical protein